MSSAIEAKHCVGTTQALGCGTADWPKMVGKIQTERKDLAKKGKLLTEEVATAAGAQLAGSFSEGTSVHYHRQAGIHADLVV